MPAMKVQDIWRMGWYSGATWGFGVGVVVGVLATTAAWAVGVTVVHYWR